MNYIDDIPNFIDEFEFFLKDEFNIDFYVEDLVILLQSEDQLLSDIHFGNLRASLVLNELKANLEYHYNVKCNYDINALDTHFYVNGEAVTTIEDILKITDKSF